MAFEYVSNLCYKRDGKTHAVSTASALQERR
jgi:hypothetical protein